MSQDLSQIPEEDVYFFKELLICLKKNLSRLLDRETETDSDQAYADEVAGLNLFSLDSYKSSVPDRLIQGYQILDFDYPPGFPTVDRFLLEEAFRCLDQFMASHLSDDNVLPRSLDDGDILDDDVFVQLKGDIDEMSDIHLLQASERDQGSREVIYLGSCEPRRKGDRYRRKTSSFSDVIMAHFEELTESVLSLAKSEKEVVKRTGSNLSVGGPECGPVSERGTTLLASHVSDPADVTGRRMQTTSGWKSSFRSRTVTDLSDVDDSDPEEASLAHSTSGSCLRGVEVKHDQVIGYSILSLRNAHTLPTCPDYAHKQTAELSAGKFTLISPLPGTDPDKSGLPAPSGSSKVIGAPPDQRSGLKSAFGDARILTSSEESLPDFNSIDFVAEVYEVQHSQRITTGAAPTRSSGQMSGTRLPRRSLELDFDPGESDV